MNHWPPAEGLVALCGDNREATPGLGGRRGLFFAASQGARVGVLGVNPKTGSAVRCPKVAQPPEPHLVGCLHMAEAPVGVLEVGDGCCAETLGFLGG